eukprot:9566971-Karenia_brevis.AAC.1
MMMSSPMMVMMMMMMMMKSESHGMHPMQANPKFVRAPMVALCVLTLSAGHEVFHSLMHITFS